MEQQVSGEEYRQMTVSSRQSKNTNKRTVNLPVIWLVIIVIVGVACFLIGESYGKDHAVKSAGATASRRGNLAGGFGGANRGLRAFGSVTAISSSSITISNQRTGADSTYNITSSTQITDNGQSVTYSDIQIGDVVVITKASTTSSNASAIDVNPSFGGFPGGAPSTNSSSGTTN